MLPIITVGGTLQTVKCICTVTLKILYNFMRIIIYVLFIIILNTKYLIL